MKTVRNARGIAIVYVTLFLLVLGLLFAALGIDVGWMVYVRTQGQAAVDAAALRAAAGIPNYDSNNSSSTLYDMATGLNNNNTVMTGSAGITNADVTLCDGDPDAPGGPSCTSSKPTAFGVRVTNTYSVPLFFSRLLNGGNNADITVSSTAWLSPVGGGKPGWPVMLCAQDIGWSFGSSSQNTCISNTPATFNPNTDNNAGYWAIGTNSMNDQTCRSLVDNPSQLPLLHMGDILTLQNGVSNACLQEIGTRFQNCNNNSCRIGNWDSACTVLVPIIDCSGGNLNQTTPLKGLASFCITSVSSQGVNKFIHANLECNVTLANSVGGGPFLGTFTDHPVLVQ